MTIAFAVTPQGILRSAVRPAVVPPLVVFAAVAPFIGAAPDAALHQDQLDLSHCPAARQEDHVHHLRQSLRQVRRSLELTTFVAKLPMPATTAESIASSFTTLYESKLQEMQSADEKAVATKPFSAKLVRALKETVWAAAETKETHTGQSADIEDSSTLTIPLLPASDGSSKRPREDCDNGHADQADRSLRLEVNTRIRNYSDSRSSDISLRGRGMPTVYIRLDEDDPDLSAGDVANTAKHFEGTRFEQLLSPLGTVALVVAIGEVMAGCYGDGAFSKLALWLFECNELI